MQDFLKIHEHDNVIVALQTLPQNKKVILEDGRVVTATAEIPAGHKMSIQDISAGSEVIKYGYRIGYAKKDIRTGDWIHTHNVKTSLGDLLEYTYEPVCVNGARREKRTEDPNDNCRTDRKIITIGKLQHIFVMTDCW
ncbi:MAG: UxaA family hydrolase [Lachnospiraceae bacterium]|nr:UxaA family hydrolase [Lachnospiraceae bacterium]